MANKYQRFGLRADKNLSDVPSPTNSLNNILEDLVVSSSDRFTAADLLVIKGLKDTRVDAARLSQINNILPSFTPDGGGDNVPALPFVTIKDQIENFKVIAGDPPFLSGGSGPLAHKYNIDCVSSRYDPIFGTAGNQGFGSSSPHADPGIGVSIVDAVRSEYGEEGTIKQGPLDFWQSGTFQQSSKLHPSFDDQFGVVVWEGFTTISNFEIDTNGCILIEQDLYGLGEWESIAAVNYYRNRYTNFSSPIVDSDEGITDVEITGTGSYPHTFFRGMKIYFEVGGSLLFSDGHTISSVYVNESGNRVVRVDEAINQLTQNTISAVHIGFDPTADTYTTDSLRFEQRYTGLYTKYRIAWFYPKIHSSLPFSSSGLDNKEFEMRFGAQDTIEYWYFYPEDPALSGGRKYSYEQFLTDRLSESVRVSNYDIVSTEPMLFDYSPKTSFGDIIPTTNITNRDQIYSVDSDIPNKRHLVSNGYNFRDNLTQGDFLLYQDTNGTRTCAQVYKFDSESDYAIYLDPNPDIEYGGFSTSPSAMTAIKKEGLVGVFHANTSASDVGGNYLNVPLSELIKGQTFDYTHIGKDMVVFAFNISNQVAQTGTPQIIKRIRGYDSGVSFYIEPLANGAAALPLGSSYLIAVYASKGLHDNTSPQQCLGVLAGEVSASQWALVGSGIYQHEITLTQSAASLGLEVGDYVQFGSDPADPNYSSVYVPNNTQIESISGSTLRIGEEIATANPDNSTLIPVNATAVFIKANNYAAGVPKEFCVVPLNTAPPFISTNDGLETPPGFSLDANSIEFKTLNLTNITSETTTASSADGYLPVYYGDTSYKLLIKNN